MEITTLTRYRVDGQEFPTLAAARQHIKHEIGKIVDATPLPLTARDRLAVFDALIAHRERLAALLTANYTDDDEFPPVRVSIFGR